MLNFFVQLINTIGLPVLLIGTFAAMPILTGEFRQIRRSCGQGDLIWEGMKNDDVWEHFLESLWRYQYTRKFVPLSPELRDTLFYECQGITDFAIKMVMVGQIRAISLGIEKISPEIIHSVAIDSFRTAQPVLKALREGDYMALRTLSDIRPVDLSAEIQRVQSSSLPTHKKSPAAVQNTTDKMFHGEQDKPAESKIATATPTRTPVRRKNSDAPIGSLLDIVRKAQSRGAAANEALKSAGLIKDTSEFLEAAA